MSACIAAACRSPRRARDNREMAIHAACTTALLRAEWRFQTLEFAELTRYETESGFPFPFSNTLNWKSVWPRLKNQEACHFACHEAPGLFFNKNCK
jgi:hypothetical protein